VADWPTKRAWLNYAYDELQAAGYSISSAYTLVKDPDKVNFSYRDNLWLGSDLLATGIASFGHVSGVHYQNVPDMEPYQTALEAGRLPLGRAMAPTQHQLLIRQMILLLKRGYLAFAPLNEKYGVDVYEQWKSVWEDYIAEGLMERTDEGVKLTRDGLLRADSLLPRFFEPEHQGIRYT
jgi:oxygen-independent coproporphyrinogen-3 oxidase